MSLEDEGRALQPWYAKIQVTPELCTDIYETTVKNKMEEAAEPFQKMLRRFYPSDLSTKTFLDCACNCGAYCYWARKAGVKSCMGFDVREHWIRQAEWLQKNMTENPTDNITFKQCDLYDLPKLNLPKSDITHFSGLFYHLPFPILGLKIAADLTNEIIIVNTQTAPSATQDSLVISYESTEWLASGVYGLNFIPSGPRAIIKILKWMGFKKFENPFNKVFEDGKGRTQVVGFR